MFRKELAPNDRVEKDNGLARDGCESEQCEWPEEGLHAEMRDVVGKGTSDRNFWCHGCRVCRMDREHEKGLRRQIPAQLEPVPTTEKLLQSGAIGVGHGVVSRTTSALVSKIYARTAIPWASNINMAISNISRVVWDLRSAIAAIRVSLGRMACSSCQMFL